ncbi:hypothetical protein AC62_1297 [Escherichia coli 6-175-07_S3_C3]|nr:hypothetical protein AB65_1598 [Escherichia coli 2-460-02_S1_C3]KEM04395.1 hypothetical protein AC62_1297 [Escherichia coli 6-175-07_S3_C3]KEO40834.1 hypothetical protein AB34_1509 [Escherichia coli 2-460-02_S1_C2]PVF82815.1 hypothetical protein CSC15_5002 [Escherichia coli]
MVMTHAEKLLTDKLSLVYRSQLTKLNTNARIFFTCCS